MFLKDNFLVVYKYILTSYLRYLFKQNINSYFTDQYKKKQRIKLNEEVKQYF